MSSLAAEFKAKFQAVETHVKDFLAKLSADAPAVEADADKCADIVEAVLPGSALYASIVDRLFDAAATTVGAANAAGQANLTSIPLDQKLLNDIKAFIAALEGKPAVK
jgi:hypothetical protein